MKICSPGTWSLQVTALPGCEPCSGVQAVSTTTAAGQLARIHSPMESPTMTNQQPTLNTEQQAGNCNL